MTDLASCTQVNMRARPSSRRSVYLDVSSRVIQGRVTEFDAAQPLDRHVAFEARHHQAERIALFGADGLAVLGKGDQHVIPRLLDRDGAGHARGVSTFGEDPLRAIAAGARILQQPSKGNTSPLRGRHHAVGELAGIELSTPPFHAGIGGAFGEVEMALGRHAPDVVHGEHQLVFHHAVDHQPVLRRVDLGDAAMVTLEMQTVRRDEAVEIVERREIDRAFGGSRKPGHPAADGAFLEGRREHRSPAHPRHSRDTGSSP